MPTINLKAPTLQKVNNWNFRRVKYHSYMNVLAQLGPDRFLFGLLWFQETNQYPSSSPITKFGLFCLTILFSRKLSTLSALSETAKKFQLREFNSKRSQLGSNWAIAGLQNVGKPSENPAKTQKKLKIFSNKRLQK